MEHIDKHKQAFLEEAAELLTDLEAALIELEEKPDDMELINRAFRALHTIKGSGGMFGFDKVASFTHEVETVFDHVRNGAMSVTKGLIDLTLSAGDYIGKIIDSPDAYDEHNANEIISAIKKLAPGSEDDKPAASEAKEAVKQEEARVDEITCRIQFCPCPDIFKKGTNPVFLINELRQLGNCKTLAYTDAIPPLGAIDPEACYTYWDIILTTDKGINAIKDVFIFAEEDCKLTIEVIDDTGKFNSEFGNKKIGEIMIERGFITQEDLQGVLRQQKRVGEILVEAKLIDKQKLQAALLEQQHLREVKESKEARESKETKESRQTDTSSSIRVSSEKLDKLVDLVGEMVTVQARLSRVTALRNDPEMLQIAEEVERLTEELRDNTMSVRLVPVGTLFTKFKRLVRDLSKDTGKEVEMVIEGAETEMDKTVIEKLNDPMVHLIRNSIDHGIESPEDRESLGKPAQGLLQLSAKHSGAYVVIEIVDDGAGLDPEVIRAKAVEKGMIAADAELTEKEIFSLILAPGFSTAKTITNVSGRGVGMDVVKRAIESLRGSINIISQKGIGTTITLKMPLTLAIIDGLLVKIGADHFVLPLSMVEECVELTGEDAARTHGRHIANVRGDIIPYIRLREQFLITGDRPELEQIVITGVDGHKVGFVVDHVVGGHQTVIKTLGRMYKDIEGISGATILGDGTVALILDIPKLLQFAGEEEAVL